MTFPWDCLDEIAARLESADEATLIIWAEELVKNGVNIPAPNLSVDEMVSKYPHLADIALIGRSLCLSEAEIRSDLIDATIAELLGERKPPADFADKLPEIT